MQSTWVEPHCWHGDCAFSLPPTGMDRLQTTRRPDREGECCESRFSVRLAQPCLIPVPPQMHAHIQAATEVMNSICTIKVLGRQKTYRRDLEVRTVDNFVISPPRPSPRSPHYLACCVSRAVVSLLGVIFETCRRSS